MKKTTLFIATLLASGTISAQTITWLPSDETHDYQGIALSANGRYIAGLSKATSGGFVWDTNSATEYLTGEDNGTIMMGVANNGDAVGYDTSDTPTLFSMAANSTSAIENIQAVSYSLSSDGNVIVGYMTDSDGNRHACIWKGGVRTMLPEPTPDEAFLDAIAGTDAKWASADGSVILGTVYENQSWGKWPLASIWKLQDDGTYKFVPIYKDFYDVSGNRTKPFYSFTASGISDNGKWVSLTTKSYGEYQGEAALLSDRMARMDLDKMTVSECVPGNGLTDQGFITGGISNDGTVVGAISPNLQRTAVIWDAKNKSASNLAVKYGLFGISDLSSSAAIAISADGRYIVGFGKVSNESEEESSASKTFWIDLKGTTDGIASATRDSKETTLSIYDMNGMLVRSGASTAGLKSGVYIIKGNGGNSAVARKIVVK